MEVEKLLNFLLLVGCVFALGPVYDVDRAPGLFVKYIKKFNKTYEDLYDLLIHYESFKQQLIKINTYNSVTSSSTDINEYTDYTDEEKIQLIRTKTVSTLPAQYKYMACLPAVQSNHCFFAYHPKQSDYYLTRIHKYIIYLSKNCFQREYQEKSTRKYLQAKAIIDLII